MFLLLNSIVSITIVGRITRVGIDSIYFVATPKTKLCLLLDKTMLGKCVGDDFHRCSSVFIVPIKNCSYMFFTVIGLAI